MRGIFFTGVFLVALALVTLILLILFPHAFPQNVAATFSSITGRSYEEPKSPPEAVEEKEEPKKKPAPRQRFTPAGPVAPEPPAVAAVTPAAAPVPAPEMSPRFPLAQDIAKGVTRSAIVSAFGPPEAIVSGADGQLRERLLYVEKTTGRKTIVFIANGKVSSAETLLQ